MINFQTKSLNISSVCVAVRKSIFIALLSLCGLNSAAASPQITPKVELKSTNITIQEFVNYLSKETGYSFFFKSDAIDTKQVISVDVESSSVNEALDKALAGTNLAYSITDKNIVIYEKAVPRVATQSIQQNTKTIKGQVLDQLGEPIIGATVSIKGTTNGAISDIDGNFAINVKTGDVIEVRYMGYQSQNIKYNSQQSLKIVLKEDSELLDEVIVVGFGTQKKVNVTGSVGTVSSKELASRPVNNVGQALQGVVPGLNLSVNSNGGMIDNKMGINIRGTGTIGDGSTASPLILIDGIEGDMNTLAPQDIENISVLKDASSSAIYGSRAAFGVILITTKSGTADKISVSYSNSFRFSKPINLPKTLSSDKFARYFNRAHINSGQAALYNDETLALIDKTMNNDWTEDEISKGYHTGTQPRADGKGWRDWAAGYASTDWFKEFYKDFAFSQEHNISVSGGSKKVTYALSGTFLGVDGLLKKGSDELQRFNLNAKVNVAINKYLNVNFSSRWAREEFDRPYHLGGLFFHNLSRRWPTNAVKDLNGHYLESSQVSHMKDGGVSKTEKDWLTNYVQIKIQPIKDWNIYLEGSHRTNSDFSHYNVLPIYQYDLNNQPIPISINENYAPGESRASEYAYKENYYTFNGFSDYFKQINKHYFKVMVGFNAELMKVRDINARANGLISPSVPTLNTATTNMYTSGGYSEWASAGFFGRANYNYAEKYLVEINMRYDGASRFIGNERWGFFPSFSLGWNMANEEFYKNYFGAFAEAVHTLKFRGSWGDSGNMNTKNWYPFYQTLPYSKEGSLWLLNGERPNTANAPGLVSSLMTWERVRQWNVGLDFGAFQNRLTGSFDYFKRTTLDMIGPAPEMPSILGATVPKVNNTDMESYGWELEIGWRDQINDWSYGAKLVLSDAQQKITRYPNVTKNLDEYYSGRMLGDIWGYTTKGIAQSQEEMDEHLKHNKPTWGSNWGAGDIMYVDLDGDGIVSSGSNTLDKPGDRRIIGNSTPRYRYGISLDAGYKGFDFSMFFQGVGKRDYSLGGGYFWGATGTGSVWQSNGFEEHWNFWRPEGDPLGANTDAYYPRVALDGGKNTYSQTRYLQDASYIRLKNIQLGYTIPRHLLEKIKISRLRVYLSGDNLWTHSSISGIFDPEALDGGWGSGKTYPLQKTFSVGINVNF